MIEIVGIAKVITLIQIILTSFKRPQNINRLINIFKAIAYPHSILLLNVNPEVKIAEYIQAENLPLVEIREYSDRKYMLFRYKMAYESRSDRFLLIDDDLFYTTEQINRLIAYYLEQPQYIHGGGFGQRIIIRNGIPELERCHPYCDGETDVVGRIYCFGRQHIEELKQLLDRLGVDFEYKLPGCDILFSWSGRPERRPICHNLGRYENCFTSNTPGIAVYKTPDFHRLRNELVCALSLNLPSLKARVFC